MSKSLKVVHLYDDATAGGVTRVLDYIATAPALSMDVEHHRVQLRRGKLSWACYGADVIVSHLALSWRALPALIALRLANRGAALLHVEHSYTESFVALNVPNKRRFYAMLRRCFAVFDRVVGVSQAQVKWLITKDLCPPYKMECIRSCVDLRPFAALPAPTSPPKVFGAIGRLDRQKGFDTLIRAFRLTDDSNLQLHFYGQGPEEQALRDLAEGDARIVFKGHVCDPKQAYAAVDAVIMPSRWEAYGLVAVEALSAGRKVVCADVDGLRDHKDYGARLIDPTDLEGFSGVLTALGQEAPNDALAPAQVAEVLEYCFVKDWLTLLHRGDLKPSRRRRRRVRLFRPLRTH